MKEKGKALKYLSFLTKIMGFSMLGVAFVNYMIVLSASLGILISDYRIYDYIENSIGLNIPSIYCNLFFILFSLGSLGAILTYLGTVIIPKLNE
jgi:hypothetical protein